MTEEKEVLSPRQRALLGALGGFSAVLVKFLGQDYASVVAHAADLSANDLLTYALSYGILTPILVYLGAFVAWGSNEKKRLKIIALAVAAPALITTYAGGAKDDGVVAPHSAPAAHAERSADRAGRETDSVRASYASLVSDAHAETNDNVKEKLQPVHPDEIKHESAWQRVRNSVALFFGYGKQLKTYHVVVGSFLDKRAAEDFADAINGEDKSLEAGVLRKPTANGYYAVTVGGRLLLSEAKELKRRALATQSIKDAYIAAAVD